MDVFEFFSKLVTLVLYMYYVLSFLFAEDKKNNKTLYNGIAAIIFLIVLNN